MAKGIRATYIVANFMNSRPEYETCEEFSHRIGLSYTLDTGNLLDRKDISAGLLYRVAKALGYQVIVYNPKPPKGLKGMYVLGEGRTKILPRELKGNYSISRDSYTGELLRKPRKYKRKKPKKFIKVKPYDTE